MKTESKIQQEMFISYSNKYCLKNNPNRGMIYHIPNEGQQRLISIGLLPGASDLVVIHFSVHHYIEVKTPEAYAKKNNGQSDSQIDFQKRIEALGYVYKIFSNVIDFNAYFRV